MAGFVDFLKKAADETDAFRTDATDLLKGGAGDVGLAALSLAGRGVGAVANSPVVENPITQNALTHAAKQTAEFVLGASQKYVTNPTFGAVAKTGVDPGFFSPLPAAKHLLTTAYHPLRSIEHPNADIKPVTYSAQEKVAQKRGDVEEADKIRQKRQAIQQAPSFTAAFNASMADDPWNQLALQIAYDPLTYLGGETQLAKIPGLAEAAETSRLASAAYKGARGVDFAAASFNKAIEAPIAGVLKGGEKLGLATKALEFTNKGKADADFSEILPALGELRQRGWNFDAIQTGPNQLKLEFNNLGHAEDAVRSQVEKVAPFDWQSSVDKKANTLTLTTTLPDTIKPQDVINKVGQRNIALSDALKPPFEGDAVEQDGIWWWDQPHEMTVQGQGTNRLTGDTRRTVQLTEGNNKKVIFFDAKPDENGKFSAVVTHYAVSPDGTKLSPAGPRFAFRLDKDARFNTAQEAIDAAQTKYETELNDFYTKNQKLHANKVNQIVRDLKANGVVDDSVLEKAFPPTNFTEHSEPLSNVTDAFQQHTLRDALAQIQGEVPQPGEQLYNVAHEVIEPANTTIPQTGDINTFPVRKKVTQQVSGDAIFNARQNVADDVNTIAQNLGFDPVSNRVKAAIKVLTPFADANTDLFAEKGSLLNTPQLVSGVEDALQTDNAQALHQTVQNLFGQAPKALPNAGDVQYPLSNALNSSVEQLPFKLAETPALESVRNQVTNLATAMKAQPQQVEQVMSVLTPVIQANPQHFIVQRIYDNPILRDGVQRALAAPSQQASQKILADTVGKIDGVFSEMGMHVPAFEKYFGWMDTKHVTPASHIGEIDAGKLSDKASATLQRVKETMPKTTEVIRNSDKYIAKFSDEKNGFLQQATQLAEANGALPPDGPLSNLNDARRVIKKYGSKDQLKGFDKFMKTWGFPKGDSADQAYTNFVSDTAMQEIKKIYNIEDKTGARNAYNLLFNMYREKALLSVRYHVANALDMTVRSVLHGNNPLIASSVTKLLAEDGIRGLPAEVSANAQRGFGPVEESSYGVDATSGFFSGLKQAARAGDKTSLGKLPVIGKIAGPAAAMNRYLSLAMDTAFRESSFYSGYVRFKHDQMLPRFTELLRQNLKPEDAKKFDSLLRDSEYRMPATEVQAQVTKLARASGSTREEAAALGAQMGGYWQQGLDEATRYGVDFTNQVFYKFSDERQIEQLLHLKGWLPFHVWATRNIPHYAETLAQNPWLVRAYLEYRGLSDQQQKQLNLTGSFAGKLSIGDLPSLLVGANNLAFINPTVAVSVFDQTQPHGEDPNANLFEKAVYDLGRVGLSPAPWISGTANILGYTHDAGTQALFNPVSGPIQALTGVNLDFPTNVVQTKLRNVLSGQLPHSTYVSGYVPPSGDPYLEYNVDKIIDQMSVEFTGHANDPLFDRAKAIPDSLIYQDALKKAKADQRFGELYRFFSPVPLTTTNPTELAIRGAEAQLPQRGSTGYKEMLGAQIQNGNIGTAHFNTSFGDQRRTQINVGLSFLQQYGWPSEYRTQFGTANSGLTGDQMAVLFKDLPWFHQYYTWLQMQPDGSDKSVSHFLATNRNTTPQ